MSLQPEDVYHFTVEYRHCDECKGWDEFYHGIQTPRRHMNGLYRDDEPRPNGLTLNGRTNHRRTCSRREP